MISVKCALALFVYQLVLLPHASQCRETPVDDELFAGVSLKLVPKAQSNETTKITSEKLAARYIESADRRLQVLNTKLVEASWNFNTDINTKNEQFLVSLLHWKA